MYNQITICLSEEASRLAPVRLSSTPSPVFLPCSVVSDPEGPGEVPDEGLAAEVATEFVEFPEVEARDFFDGSFQVSMISLIVASQLFWK